MSTEDMAYFKNILTAITCGLFDNLPLITDTEEEEQEDKSPHTQFRDSQMESLMKNLLETHQTHAIWCTAVWVPKAYV